jgi:hypothetical protein
MKFQTERASESERDRDTEETERKTDRKRVVGKADSDTT